MLDLQLSGFRKLSSKAALLIWSASFDFRWDSDSKVVKVNEVVKVVKASEVVNVNQVV